MEYRKEKKRHPMISGEDNRDSVCVCVCVCVCDQYPPEAIKCGSPQDGIHL